MKCGADGMIVGNTSSKRAPDLALSEDGATVGAKERGGLSGEPIRELSLAAIKGMYSATGGKIPIVGCGGISTGEHAYAAIRAGASLLQLYTAMVSRKMLGRMLQQHWFTRTHSLYHFPTSAGLPRPVGSDHDPGRSRRAPGTRRLCQRL